MMKKSLLAFATLALATGAWAEKQTVSHLGVNYEYDPATIVYGTPSTTSDTRTLNTDGATSGALSFSGNIYQSRTATVNQGVTAVSLSLATPVFEEWVNGTGSTDNDRNQTTADVSNVTPFANIVAYIEEAGVNTLYTWDEVKAFGDGQRFQGWQRTSNGTWTSPKVRTSENDFESYFNGTTTGNGTFRPNASNFVYYKATIEEYDEDEDDYYDVVCYYAIYKLSIDVTTTTTTTTTTTYTPTTIPSGLDWDNVTTVTIGSSIVSIDNDAFKKNAGSIEKFIINNNDKFGFSENILYTIDPENEVIFFSSLLNGTPVITLNGSFTIVRDYATKYITSSMIVYYECEESEFTVDETKQSESVTFTNANADITMEDNGKGDGGYKVKLGTIINEKQFNKAIEDYIGIATYLDFTGADFGSLRTSITDNYNNKLILVGKGTQISGINVVYIDEDDNRICDEFQLDDNYKNQKFFSPTSFTAKVAQYTNRSFSTNWGTIMLPFGATSIPSGFNCGTIQSYNTSNNEITFTSVNSVTANVPYLIYSETEGDNLPVFYNVNVVSTSESKYSSSVNGASIVGSYEQIYVKSDDEETYIFSGGKLYYAPSTLENGAKINCFRGYITTPAGTYNPDAPAATVRFITEQETAIESISDVKETQNEGIYNLSGQRVNEASVSGIYVKNGKKIFVKK